MRKVLAGLLCVLLLLLAGCSGTSVSDKASTAAKSAVEIADGYLDNELTQDSARDGLDALEEEMAYTADMSQDDKNKAGDSSVSTGITVLSSSILTDSIKNDAASHDKVVDARNKLAGYAGVKKR